MGFFRRQKDKFLIPIIAGPGPLPVDQMVDRCRSQSTGPVNRRAQTCTAAWADGPVDRAVDRRESSALWKWPRPTGRSTGRALCIQSRSTGRYTGGTTVIFMTVGPVDRKGKNALSCCQRAEILWGYKYPIWVGFSTSFSREKFSFFLVLKIQVLKEFWA